MVQMIVVIAAPYDCLIYIIQPIPLGLGVARTPLLLPLSGVVYLF